MALRRANVDTDQILPGRYAPYMTSEADLGKYPFIEARPEFAQQVQPGDIIVAGANFGCGSSREYAPRALKVVGLAAIIAPSFSRIFLPQRLNLGLRAVRGRSQRTGEPMASRSSLDLEQRLLAGAGSGAFARLPPATRLAA